VVADALGAITATSELHARAATIARADHRLRIPASFG
jgi:hypothetical protein